MEMKLCYADDEKKCEAHCGPDAWRGADVCRASFEGSGFIFTEDGDVYYPGEDPHKYACDSWNEQVVAK